MNTACDLLNMFCFTSYPNALCDMFYDNSNGGYKSERVVTIRDALMPILISHFGPTLTHIA